MRGAGDGRAARPGAGLSPDGRGNAAARRWAASVACRGRFGAAVRRLAVGSGRRHASGTFAAAGKRFGAEHVRAKPVR